MTTPLRLHTIYYLPIELPPLAGEGQLQPQYADLPASWRVALEFLAADIDLARCENDCGTSIGYVLDENDRLQWRIAYLAKRDDNGIVRLCEGCSPACPALPRADWLPERERTT